MTAPPELPFQLVIQESGTEDGWAYVRVDDYLKAIADAEARGREQGLREAVACIDAQIEPLDYLKAAARRHGDTRDELVHGYAADQLRHVRRAILALPADGWQGIETAPKGTPILAATDEIKGGVIILSWFHYNGSEAWRDGDGDSYLRVTRWRPLPAPPPEPQE